MYKKIYLEITNNCNLSCSFCIKNSRPNMFLSKDNFINILDKIKDYTNYLYFHILGEPLLHPNINEFINIANENKFKVNITTNGYLIKNIIDNKNIRQLNISLHSYNEIYKIDLQEYMSNIFNVVDVLSQNTYISYRIWLKNKYTEEILKLLNKKYNTNLTIDNIKNNSTLSKNVFISINEEFIWPSLDNNYYSEIGNCYALKDHIGILVDGTIVPCCLDTKGIIKLGNIYKDNLTDVINSDRYQGMLNGFKHNKKCELLCKKCNFLDK
ncbi:MAG: radical SAM protein [Bacilli bacterium]|nr:radical SAM protein [Bacilli bacterium]